MGARVAITAHVARTTVVKHGKRHVTQKCMKGFVVVSKENDLGIAKVSRKSLGVFKDHVVDMHTNIPIGDLVPVGTDRGIWLSVFGIVGCKSLYFGPIPDVQKNLGPWAKKSCAPNLVGAQPLTLHFPNIKNVKDFAVSEDTLGPQSQKLQHMDFPATLAPAMFLEKRHFLESKHVVVQFLPFLRFVLAQYALNP